MRFIHKPQGTTRLHLIIAALASLTVSACGDSAKDDLASYVESVQLRFEADIPPIPSMQAVENFTYAASNLRDPFVPTVIDKPVEQGAQELFDAVIQPDGERRKEALEAYELSELRFTGTLERDRIWGLVRTPNGVIHSVQTGNYLGTNHGKIVAITDTALQLVEIVPEGGGYVERETVLPFAEVR